VTTHAVRPPTPSRTLQRPTAEFPRTVADPFFAGRPSAWHSGACAAAGHAFDLSVEGPDDAVDLLQCLTRPLRAHRGPRPVTRYRVLHRDHEHIPWALYADGTRLLLSQTPETLVAFFGWHLNQRMVELTCRDHVVLHAAAAARAGITLVLPGAEEHGKTTTVAGLLRAGWDYVTDEAVAVDPETLWLTPFPKALSIDEGAWPLFPELGPVPGLLRQLHVRAEQLSGRSLCVPVRPPRLLVFPRYVAGSRTALTPLSPAEAVRALAESTFNFTRDPHRNLRVLGALATSATVARLTIGRLDHAVAALDGLLSEHLGRELGR